MAKVGKKKGKKPVGTRKGAPLEPRATTPADDRDEDLDPSETSGDEPEAAKAEQSPDDEADEASAGADESAGDAKASSDGDDEDAEVEDEEKAGADEAGEAPASGTGEDEGTGEVAAAQLGATRWVTVSFIALWMLGAYVGKEALTGLWDWAANRDFFSRNLPALAAVPHEGEFVSRSNISLIIGALLSGIIALYYYRKASVRAWADEVSEELGKVKWPTRKEVSSNTVTVLAVSAVITVYLTVLDRLWGFVTAQIYTTGG